MASKIIHLEAQMRRRWVLRLIRVLAPVPLPEPWRDRLVISLIRQVKIDVMVGGLPIQTRTVTASRGPDEKWNLSLT